MCMILDANMFSRFINKNDKDMQPIHKWLLNKSGKLVYTDYHKYQSELKKAPKLRQQMLKLKRANQARFVEKNKVEEKIKSLGRIQSNDPHILALAQTANVNLLCSEDKKLGFDFKDLIPNAAIYKNKDHAHLLNDDICP